MTATPYSSSSAKEPAACRIRSFYFIHPFSSMPCMQVMGGSWRCSDKLPYGIRASSFWLIVSQAVRQHLRHCQGPNSHGKALQGCITLHLLNAAGRRAVAESRKDGDRQCRQRRVRGHIPDGVPAPVGGRRAAGDELHVRR